MKKTLLLASLLFFLACNNEDSNNNANQPVSNDTLAFGENANDTLYFWNVDNENGTRKKVLVQPIEHPNTQAIVNGINMVYPDVLLELTKTSNDTLYLTIPQSEKLTQQMGSAGAAQYFATACINLFVLPHINYVHFDFKEGDHARPDTYSRDQFASFKEVQ